MNQRLLKEARGLLPFLGWTLLAVAIPRILFGKSEFGQGVIGFGFTLMLAIMAAYSFAGEFQWRTFPLLLTQPVNRDRIWLEKMGVLGTAVLLAWAFLFGFAAWRWEPGARLGFSLIPLCVLCGTPLISVFSRHPIGATVGILGLPFALWALLALLVQGYAWLFPQSGIRLLESMDQHPAPYISSLIFGYCSLTLWLGFVEFRRMQAIEAQVQDLKLPGFLEDPLGRVLSLVTPRYSGPWSSLVRKEFRLQRPAYLVGAVLVILILPLWLSLALTHKIVYKDFLGLNLGCLAAIAPLVALGISVAEERTLGLSEWQRLVPVASLKQWLVKVAVTWFTCVLLGVVVPACLFAIIFGIRELYPVPGNPYPAFIALNLLYICIAHTALVSVGLFTSSLCRSALGGIISFVALAPILFGVQSRLGLEFFQRQAGTFKLSEQDFLVASLVQGLTYVLPTILLQFLAYSNFRNGFVSAKKAWLQVGAVIGFVFIGTILLLLGVWVWLSNW